MSGGSFDNPPPRTTSDWVFPDDEEIVGQAVYYYYDEGSPQRATLAQMEKKYFTVQLSDTQLEILENFYAGNQRIWSRNVIELAKETDLSPDVVLVWIQLRNYRRRSGLDAQKSGDAEQNFKLQKVSYYYSKKDGEPKMAKTDKTQRQFFTCLIKESQLELLRKAYAMDRYPMCHIKSELVKDTQLSRDVVAVWFQNERFKERLLN